MRIPAATWKRRSTSVDCLSFTAGLRWRESVASQQRLLTGARPIGHGPATLTQPMAGKRQKKGGSGLKAILHSYAGKTVLASKTGPSTHTRFIAGPSGVSTRTAQPAQPPTAQAMYSSSETWQGMP